MNRAWLTALTLAGVAGSAGAAFANVVSTPDAAATPDVGVAQSPGLLAATNTAGDAAVTSTYQLSGVAVVTLSVRDQVITVASVTAVPGWTTQAISVPGALVTVQLTGGTQVVTFTASLVGGTVSATVTNELAPGVTTATPAPIEPVVAPPATVHGTTPKAATPPTTKSTTATTTKTTMKPVTTTAPSSGGDDEGEPNDD